MKRPTPREAIASAVDALEQAVAMAKRDALVGLARNLALSPKGSAEEIERRIVDHVVALRKQAHSVSIASPMHRLNAALLLRAVHAAASVTGVDVSSAAPRSPERVLARHAVWYALRDLGLSSKATGRLDILGTADHATVLSAWRKADRMTTATEEGRRFLAAVAEAKKVIAGETGREKEA